MTLETNIFHLLSIPSWSCSHPNGCEGLLRATCFPLLPSAEGPAPSNGIPELRQARASGSSHPGIVTRAGFLLRTLEFTNRAAGDEHLQCINAPQCIDQQSMHRLLESEGRCSMGLKHCGIASRLPLKSVGAGLLYYYLFLLFILDEL